MASSLNRKLSTFKDKNFLSHKLSITDPKKEFLKTNAVILACLTIGLSLYYTNDKKKRVFLKASESVGEFKSNLPSYTIEEVTKHDSAEKRVWVTYRQGVYDISDFISKHPGGDKILLAAGGSVEPFWLMYGVHKTPEILAILEMYRIGEEEGRYLMRANGCRRASCSLVPSPQGIDENSYFICAQPNLTPFAPGCTPQCTS